jgi:hypothetical protein
MEKDNLNDKWCWVNKIPTYKILTSTFTSTLIQKNPNKNPTTSKWYINLNAGTKTIKWLGKPRKS